MSSKQMGCILLCFDFHHFYKICTYNTHLTANLMQFCLLVGISDEKVKNTLHPGFIKFALIFLADPDHDPEVELSHAMVATKHNTRPQSSTYSRGFSNAT